MHLLNATHVARYPHSELNMTLLPEPPIIGRNDIRVDDPKPGVKLLDELRLDSVTTAIDAFEADVAQWKDDADAQIKVEPGGNAALTQNRTRESRAWKSRIEDTLHILSELRPKLQTFMTKDDVFIYDLNQGRSLALKPAGFMLMRVAKARRGIPVVSYLVTHPGTVGVGGALLERAVNVSQRNGTAGRLQIFPTTDIARRCYLRLGFTRQESWEMDDDWEDRWLELDPVGSEKWTYVDEAWHLAKYVGTISVAFPDSATEADGAGQ